MITVCVNLNVCDFKFISSKNSIFESDIYVSSVYENVAINATPGQSVGHCTSCVCASFTRAFLLKITAFDGEI